MELTVDTDHMSLFPFHLGDTLKCWASRQSLHKMHFTSLLIMANVFINVYCDRNQLFERDLRQHLRKISIRL